MLVCYRKTQYNTKIRHPLSTLPRNAIFNPCYIGVQCVHLVGIYVTTSPFALCCIKARRCSFINVGLLQ
jgi:hypothetical protein